MKEPSAPGSEMTMDPLPDGFPGEQISVLPGPLIAQATRRPPMDGLLVTDVGFFPHAQRHGRSRPDGTAEHIIIICASGGGWCKLKNSTYKLRAGQVLVIPPNTPHSYGADPKDPWTIWWAHVRGAAAAATLGMLPRRAPIFTLANPADAMVLVRQIIVRISTDQTVSALTACSGLAWNLICLLVADYRPSAPRSLDPIDVALSHLRSSTPTTINVGELSRIVGLSESYLSTLFKKRIGMGILEYQTQQKMALARELLDTTDMPISEVARRTGYEDAFYFSRRFRAAHSMSPKQYRARCK